MRGSLIGMENSIQKIGKNAERFSRGHFDRRGDGRIGGEKRITPVNSVLP